MKALRDTLLIHVLVDGNENILCQYNLLQSDWHFHIYGMSDVVLANRTQEPSRGGRIVNQEKDEKQRSAQEYSLRRQKQKELFDEVELEHSRIERELQDTERVKLIEQYLDDVYTRYGASTKTLQLDVTSRCKTTPKRQGNIYSWLPRKQAHDNSKPASILHPFKESTNNISIGCVDNKIEFKEKQAKNDAKFRFFNDWSKTAFINYVNSEGEFLMNEADQDFSSQFKDPSYWMKKHHQNGVVLKSNLK
ncbi:hypothetical protein QZH41_005288 [Actinostola sp. cb2023]|nr:hypothetical protein QZH41_005288 [Actinostola sp. cb2023]